MASDPSSGVDTPAFQRALAEVLVVPETLALLQTDPKAFAERFELTAAQLDAFAFAGLGTLEEFAHDLMEKRMNLIARFSPALVGLLARRGHLPGIVRKFVRAHPSRSVAEVPHKVVRDCQWFHDFVERWVQHEGIDEPYLAPILRFERVGAELLADDEAARAARRFGPPAAEASLDPADVPRLYPVIGTHLRIVAFSCDITRIVRTLVEQQPLPPSPPPPETSLIITREPGRRSVRHVRINERTRSLLERCDGTVPVSQLVRSYRERWSPELTEYTVLEAVSGVLSGMMKLGMLRLLDRPAP